MTTATQGEWTPLVTNWHLEPFADTDTDAETEEPTKIENFITTTQATSIVTSVFIVMAGMLVASILAITFYWSYYRDVSLFICIISGITFLYAVANVIYIGVQQSKYDPLSFQVFMGSGIFMSITYLLLVIYFGSKSNTRANSGLGGIISQYPT